ncbi:inositol monophosphatase 1 isoform X3 [Canis lupus dingo]|uniref:Inositol-1-monophosphatase n=1 Tax=Canis lupus familiaris TaxID=9615 RepID=A0A8I3P0D5_CANLF|nr:inositol monophosphatase 1 isoform X3 [Canis lupus dingo]XP_048959671.1 inositol monophosphatase 1 isoform X3 [Canis lupus dingo]
MADPWQECMDYAVTLARQAGEVVREAIKNEMNVMIKSSPADLVTATDQKIEKMLLSSIKEKYPSHSFIGEESVAAGEKSILTDSPTWIIDPIDGTTNFVHRFPFVAVSIGFTVNKKMEFGVVYSCLEDKMYTGRKGKGAFCNGQKLQVSQQEGSEVLELQLLICALWQLELQMHIMKWEFTVGIWQELALLLLKLVEY